MNEPRQESTPKGEDLRLQSLGAVAGELMHDLANVLAVVHGRATLALGEAREGRTPLEDLQHVVESTAEMNQMLRDVLETLRGRALSPEVTFSPKQVVDQVTRRFTRGLNRIEANVISSLPADVRVAGRASFLTRVLQNLLGNAVRHARSKIEIRLSLAEGGDRHHAVVEVADDGPGLVGDQIAGLFHPLTQGENAGMAGLGLSSVRWAVEQMGGEIEFGAADGLGGAAFRVRLPLVEPRRPTLPASAPKLQGRTIVVIDDDEAVRMALVRLLERVGAKAVGCSPVGSQEDEVLRLLLAAMPDVILLNIRLGARDGGEVWRALRDQVPMLAERVVFMSGLAPGDPSWDAARATGQTVLAKPLDLEILADAAAAVVQAQ